MRRVLGLTLALVAAAFTSAGASVPARQVTTATVYRAYRADGTSVLHTHSRSGYCWTASGTTSRSDAWRCMTGNEIEDPCFSTSLSTSSVICPDAPWKNTGVEIRLAKPPPRRYANHAAPSLHAQPWALELYDGRRCLLASGASTALEGKRLNYFCGAGSHAGLWGFPNRRSEPWTILTAPFDAKHLVQRATIRHAWM